jgi:ferredoxin
VCHTCEAALRAGAIDHEPEPFEAPATGSAFICCARPREDLVLDL